MHDIGRPASGFVQGAIWSPHKPSGQQSEPPATLDEVPWEMRVQDKLCSTSVTFKVKWMPVVQVEWIQSKHRVPELRNIIQTVINVGQGKI